MSIWSTRAFADELMEWAAAAEEHERTYERRIMRQGSGGETAGGITRP